MAVSTTYDRFEKLQPCRRGRIPRGHKIGDTASSRRSSQVVDAIREAATDNAEHFCETSTGNAADFSTDKRNGLISRGVDGLFAAKPDNDESRAVSRASMLFWLVLFLTGMSWGWLAVDCFVFRFLK